MVHRSAGPPPAPLLRVLDVSCRVNRHSTLHVHHLQVVRPVVIALLFLDLGGGSMAGKQSNEQSESETKGLGRGGAVSFECDARGSAGVGGGGAKGCMHMGGVVAMAAAGQSCTPLLLGYSVSVLRENLESSRRIWTCMPAEKTCSMRLVGWRRVAADSRPNPPPSFPVQSCSIAACLFATASLSPRPHCTVHARPAGRSVCQIT